MKETSASQCVALNSATQPCSRRFCKQQNHLILPAAEAGDATEKLDAPPYTPNPSSDDTDASISSEDVEAAMFFLDSFDDLSQDADVTTVINGGVPEPQLWFEDTFQSLAEL